MVGAAVILANQVRRPIAAPKPDPPQEFEEWWADFKRSPEYMPGIYHRAMAYAGWSAARKAPSIEREMREALEQALDRMESIKDEQRDGHFIITRCEAAIAYAKSVLKRAAGEPDKENLG